MPEVPHLSLPLRIEFGSYAAVEQDTVDELAVNVACVTSFERGTRADNLAFGIESVEFAQRPLDLTDVEDTIAPWEPRAQADVSEVALDANDPSATTLSIQVSMPDDESNAEEA
jgi:hypothetical protein